ncbi:hypothetical protein EPYR_01574 [Erwinia pyrifoliae DSM 12163]|nr:hypothetical protein EPYR_01574 [Erwinia pyrifoliae DSM 12163]
MRRRWRGLICRSGKNCWRAHYSLANSLDACLQQLAANSVASVLLAAIKRILT